MKSYWGAPLAAAAFVLASTPLGLPAEKESDSTTTSVRGTHSTGTLGVQAAVGDDAGADAGGTGTDGGKEDDKGDGKGDGKGDDKGDGKGDDKGDAGKGDDKGDEATKDEKPPKKTYSHAKPATPKAKVDAAAVSKTKYLIPYDDNTMVISHWPLTFTSGDVPDYLSDDGSGPTPSSSARTIQNLDAMAVSLSSIYEDVNVEREGLGFVIVGPKERVRRIKTILAKWVDIPFPLVNLNVMSFQASSRNYKSEEMMNAVELADAGIKLTREFLRAYVLDFHKFIREGDMPDPKDSTKRVSLIRPTEDEQGIIGLFAEFHLLGPKKIDGAALEDLDSGRGRVKPFVDELAYLALADHKQFYRTKTLKDEFQKFIQDKGVAAKLLASFVDQLGGRENALKADAKLSPGSKKRGLETLAKLQDLCARLHQAIDNPYPVFSALVANSDEDADLRSMLEFMREYSLPNTFDDLDPGKGARARQHDLDSQTALTQDLDRIRKQMEQAKSLQSSTAAKIRAAQEEMARLSLGDTQAAVDAETANVLNQLHELKVEEVAQLKIAKGNTSPDKEVAQERVAQIRKDQEDLKNDLKTLRKGFLPRTEARLEALKTQLQKLDTSHGLLLDDLSALEQEYQRLRHDLAVANSLVGSKNAVKAHGDQPAKYVPSGSSEEKLLKTFAKPTRPVDPEALTMASANVDEMIRNVTETFSRDLEASIIEPLKQWIVDNNRGKKDGLVFTGDMGLAVTSSRGAASGGSATFFTPYTPQQHLSADDLTKLFTAGQGLSLFSSQGIEAVTKVLAGIGDGYYKPTWTTIGPGLDLGVRPSVLPGARSARLQINFRASADVKDTDMTARGPDPFNRVNAHETRTDVAISAFDLFPLSTFSVETTALGDPQWRIYGLEGIPIIGNIFIGPRRPVTSVGKALVVVYATVLPRSLDVARRYSLSSD